MGAVAEQAKTATKAAPVKADASMANMSLIHLIEMLSWGDAGAYLCIPASALAGAAINAVGTPEQLERFLRRFTEGEPKWGAMAMTEPQAGSDTSNIQTTAVYDEETDEWGAQRAENFLHQRQARAGRIRRPRGRVGRRSTKTPGERA